jgi:quinol monooxygenase YgiN
MIILAGTIRIAPGKRDEALAPVQTMIQATRAEPGCLSYAFAFDVFDDHLLHIFEVFEDDLALAAHRASPHMAAWRAAWPQVGIAGRDMSQYEVSGYRKI